MVNLWSKFWPRTNKFMNGRKLCKPKTDKMCFKFVAKAKPILMG